jgi:hypothetical protein
MALDPTAREANVRDSIKKFFVDNIYRTEGVEVTFDTELSTPKIQGIEVDKWITINFGEFNFDNMSDYNIDVYCCTKNDSEGFKLAQLRDKVMGYLTDSSKADGMGRVTLYRSYADRPWEIIGYLMVFVETESKQMVAPDGTKFKMIPCTLKWGAKP